MKATLLLAVSFLLLLACDTEDNSPPAADSSTLFEDIAPISAGPAGKECLDRYQIGSSVFRTSPGPETGAGELEQRVLEKDLVVRAVAMEVELKAVEIDSLKFELKAGYDRYYESYKYTLLSEVRLHVQEYLKGEGPNTITAVVEGQREFNSPEEGACAKSAFLADFPKLLASREGIALLDRTNDSRVYHMGLAYDNFEDTAYPDFHSTWLPGEQGKFYNRSTDEWISIDDVRKRASSVLDEYNRRDDEEWKDCVFHKYYDEGSDPWAYRGVPWPLVDYRDHNIMFHGERIVPAGTVVWISDDPGFYDESGAYTIDTSRRMWLEGEDAHLFDITYHSEYEYTAGEWSGRPAPGTFGHHLAVWYRPNPEDTVLWQKTISGYVITAAEDLEEGEYSFNLPFEYEGWEVVDCGQEKFRPSQVYGDRRRGVAAPSTCANQPEGSVLVRTLQRLWTGEWMDYRVGPYLWCGGPLDSRVPFEWRQKRDNGDLE